MNNNHFYVVEQDTDPSSPREDDNLGTMYCAHRRYRLGDVQFDGDVNKQRARLLDWDSEEHSESAINKEFDAKFIWLNLYLYAHGGITMNTTGFSCPWDSGQVGFIAVSKAKVREEYGWKQLTQKRIQQIEGYLRGEVETYDQFLQGEVYGFRVFSVTPEFAERYAEDLERMPLQEFVEEIADSGWLSREEYDRQIEETDSCWGFYGKAYCEEEAKAIVKYQDEHWQEYQDRESGQQQLPLAA